MTILTPAYIAVLEQKLKERTGSVQLPVSVVLPRGRQDYQSHSSDDCTAHGVLNVAETCGLKIDIDPHDITARARKLGGIRFDKGAWLGHSFAAYCEIVGGCHPVSMRFSASGLQDPRIQARHGHIWPDVIQLWMAATRTSVAVSMQWFAADDAPGPSNVLEGGKGMSSNHVVTCHGYQPHEWDRYTSWLRFLSPKRKDVCMLLENSLSGASKVQQYAPTRRFRSLKGHVTEAYSLQRH